MIGRLSRWLALALPLAALGCSSDPREGYISSALQVIDDATSQIATIKDKVNESIAKAKDNKLNGEALKDAVDAVNSLRENGKRMQLIKQRTDGVGATLTEDEKEDFRKRFGTKVQNSLEQLEEERTKLQEVLHKAETLDPDGIRDLRSQLTEAEGFFAVLARQQ